MKFLSDIYFQLFFRSLLVRKFNALFLIFIAVSSALCCVFFSNAILLVCVNVGFLLFLYIFLYFKFIKPLRDLMHHIDIRSIGERSPYNYSHTEEWEPFFKKVTLSFQVTRNNQEAIERINKELYQHRHNLEQLVLERTKELSNALESLKSAQDHLIESEKMASLGELVAGIAHEINTPIGVGVTASSHLAGETNALASKYESGEVTQQDFEAYIETARESTSLILSNLERASDLILNFKQVAVDQSHEEKRDIALLNYIQSVLKSLSPRLKQGGHTVVIEGDKELNVLSYPGAIAQIITNFVTNSLVHAFEKGQSGLIEVIVTKNKDLAEIHYRDNGKGMDESVIDNVFQPFYTTKRNNGGTGLGMSIVFNIISQKLNGSIDVESKPDKGTWFTLSFPIA